MTFKYAFSRRVKIIFFRLLSKIWWRPFGFYAKPIKLTNRVPTPLNPKNYRDLCLQKMMFPDNQLRSVVADKIACRGFIKETVGEEYLIPLQGVLDDPASFDPNNFEFPYVVKSNHASGQVRLIRSQMCLDGLVDTMKQWLAVDYNHKYEWCYKNIKAKILVETLLQDSKGNIPPDYKIHCFYGEPVLICRVQDFFEEHTEDYMTPTWELIHIEGTRPLNLTPPEKPRELEELLEVARKISKSFDLIRVDLYACDGKIYCGEITNFNLAGNLHYKPIEYDEYLYQKYLTLGEKWVEKNRDHYTTLGST